MKTKSRLSMIISLAICGILIALTTLWADPILLSVSADEDDNSNWVDGNYTYTWNDWVISQGYLVVIGSGSCAGQVITTFDYEILKNGNVVYSGQFDVYLSKDVPLSIGDVVTLKIKHALTSCICGGGSDDCVGTLELYY